MKEEFVTYDIAVKLKEKGFKEKCFAYYYPKGSELIFNKNQFRGGIVEDCLYSNNSLPNECMASDFDGTCVSHEFPKVGKDIGAVPVLKKLVERGHKLILHTMRGDGQSFHNGELIERSGRFANCDSVLDDAVRWFNENGIPLYGVNNNPQQKHWTDSKKVFAHMYIDDSALGIPLKLDEDGSVSRPYVDWSRVEQLLEEKGVIDYQEKRNNTWEGW